MERKVFYTLKRKKRSMGIEQVNGFELNVNDNKLYGYINREYGKVHVIDPETGRGIYTYPDFYECQEIDAIKDTVDRLMEDRHILEKFERKRDSEEYKMMQEIFQSFLHGAEIEEKMEKGRKAG